MINGNFSFSSMAPFTQRKNATAGAKNSFDHGPCSGVKILDPKMVASNTSAKAGPHFGVPKLDSKMGSANATKKKN